ncbi:MAG: tetratricopeptide repeat protein [Anaerolineae bacterium]|nr:tetratricopeptide repeat protein [Anaerolineae bacterium]
MPSDLGTVWLLIALVAYVILTLILLFILWRLYRREVTALQSRIEEKEKRAQEALTALEEERQRLRRVLQEAGLTAELPTDQPLDLEAARAEPETRETLASIISRINGLEIAIPQAPPPATLDLIEMGNTYFLLGQFEKAIEKYTEAVLNDPQASKAYYNLGLACANLGRNEAAIRDFDRAIQLDPSDPKAYANRGTAYGGLGETEKEVEDYTKAIELDPTYTTAYYNRGLAYTTLGLNEAAIKDFAKQIELDPWDARAYLNRGWPWGSWSGTRRRSKITLKPSYSTPPIPPPTTT